MFCSQCGTNLPDDAQFCAACGARVSDMVESGTVREGVAAESPSSSPAPSGKRKKTGLIIGIVAVVVVALVGVGVYAFLSNKAYEEAHKEIAVPIDIVIEGYGDGAGSGIPVAVEGTDLDGAKISTRVVLGSEGGQVALKRGTYTIRPAGPPVSDEGRLFVEPSQPVELSIGEGGVSLSDGNGSVKFKYEAVPAEQVTDEQIQAARDWMTSFDVAAETADALVNKVAAVRQAEIDRIAEEKRKADEEAQKRAEEEARKRAEEEKEARRDKLTGTFGSSGAAAPRGRVTSITFGDGEVYVTGELFRSEGGSFRESVGDKTWVFGIDDNTEFGFALYDGFHEQSIDEVAGYWASGNFPAIHIILENGMVKRIWQSA